MNRRIRVVAGVLGAVLAVAFFLATPSPALALQDNDDDDGPQRTVRVAGTGRVSAQPDRAVVTLGVQTEAEEASAVLMQNNEQMQALVETLRNVGLEDEDIRTQTVRLTPRYENPGPEGRQPEPAGYTATNLVQIRVQNLGSVGEILDAAVQAGGNRIEGIGFEVSDPAQYLDQAREAAWHDALGKAEQLAALAGTELGPVLTIDESLRGPESFMTQTVAMEAASAVPIEPGSQTIQLDLQVTWLLGGDD